MWLEKHTQIVPIVKEKVKALPCIGIPHPNAFMIVDATISDIGCDGMLKQKEPILALTTQIIRYHFGSWIGA